jgi:cyclohexa-1,5-dienecarbonyl-CoA hydratase
MLRPPFAETGGASIMANEEARIDEFTAAAALTPADFQFVKYSVDAGVARMTLNRPKYNELNERMLKELAVGIESLSEKDDVKVIVLDSALEMFCGGIEIREYTTERVFQVLDAFHHIFLAMLDIGKPVITVINGKAIGGGCELAAFGDMVIATPKAVFAQPEIKLGVFPPLATTIFPFIVGPKLALEIVLTGQAITAERACELGLVNRLVPEDQLEKTVKELIVQITSQSGAVLNMAKKAVLDGMGMSLREGMRNSMNIFLNELYRLEDSQEGLRALLEKRKPQWKNR